MEVGMAVGGREDDYEASGVPFTERGRRFEQMIEEIERTWQEGKVGPKVDPPPAILIGGGADVVYERVARHAAGWIMGGGPPEMLRDGREKTLTAWKEAGREGEPRIAALLYYALGDDAERHADEDLRHDYGFLGEYAEQIASGAATDEDTIRQYLKDFEAAGCDEVIAFPCNPDPEQVDLPAKAALGND